jgi:DNA-binding FadR family transcriptional regulator
MAALLGLISHLIDKMRWSSAMAVASQTGPTEAWQDHPRIIKAMENRTVADLQAEIRLHLKYAKERYLSSAEMLL